MLPNDISKVYDIERKSFAHPFGESIITNIYFSAPELCFVIINKDINKKENIIGFLLGGRTEFSHEVHIMSIAILKDYREQGYGRDLLNYFINSVKKRGFSQITLEVRIDNEVAIKLYEDRGFKKTKRVRKYYEDNSDAFVYELRIK